MDVSQLITAVIIIKIKSKGMLEINCNTTKFQKKVCYTLFLLSNVECIFKIFST